jgi:hypothetical protein
MEVQGDCGIEKVHWVKTKKLGINFGNWTEKSMYDQNFANNQFNLPQGVKGDK